MKGYDDSVIWWNAQLVFPHPYFPVPSYVNVPTVLRIRFNKEFGVSRFGILKVLFAR